MRSEALEQQIAASIAARVPGDAFDAMCQHASARQQVWWACLCAWSQWRPQPAAEDDHALRIASGWVFGGDDDQRRQAALRAASPEAGRCQWLLQAVVNSGGSLKFADRPVDQPTPHLAGRFIHGFLQKLMAQCPPVQRAQVAQTFAQFAHCAIAEPLPTVEPSQAVASPALPRS